MLLVFHCSEMKTIGRYLVIIISLVVMTLSVEGRFNEEEMQNFLNDIFKFHNKYRQKHNVEILQRTTEIDLIAAQMLDDMLFGNYNKNHNFYGSSIYEKKYNQRTQLNTIEAKNVLFEWYSKGYSYNYLYEPSDYEFHKEFTQIVWKDTTLIGLAMQWTKDKYIVQIAYYPRGNIFGQFKKNVLQRPSIAHFNKSVLNLYLYNNDKKHFEDYIVNLHNEARKNHGVPELRRDIDFDAFTENILKKILENTYKNLEYYGKNFLTRSYDDYTLLDEAEAKAVFLEWYNKGEYYDYSVEPESDLTAEFTQIVWRYTKTIGISMLAVNGYYNVLVLYNPPGNIKGEFRTNVIGPQYMQQGESSSSHIDN